MPDRISKVAVLLSFYATADEEAWKEFSPDYPMTEDGLMTIIGFVVNKVDDKRVDWAALVPFVAIALGHDNGKNDDVFLPEQE